MYVFSWIKSHHYADFFQKALKAITRTVYMPFTVNIRLNLAITILNHSPSEETLNGFTTAILHCLNALLCSLFSINLEDY
jgi:hypothetical protein